MGVRGRVGVRIKGRVKGADGRAIGLTTTVVSYPAVILINHGVE